MTDAWINGPITYRPPYIFILNNENQTKNRNCGEAYNQSKARGDKFSFSQTIDSNCTPEPGNLIERTDNKNTSLTSAYSNSKQKPIMNKILFKN